MAESKKNNNNSARCEKTNNNKMESTTIDEGQIRLRDEATQSMLKRKKLHLVLDLDNTLLHTTPIPENLNLTDKDYSKLKRALKDDLFGFVSKFWEYVTRLRPGVREFLKEASTMFDFTIYTRGNRFYAEGMAEILDQSEDRSWFTRIIARDDHPEDMQKGLHRVLSNERMVLIVDDLAMIWRTADRDNLINVHPYSFFPREMNVWPKYLDEEGENEDELARVLSILKAVHSKFYSGKSGYAKKDVRQVLKKVRKNLVRGSSIWGSIFGSCGCKFS